MSPFKLAACAVVLGLGFVLWRGHEARKETAAVRALTDSYGFVALGAPQGADPRKVWIVAAVNCPKDGAQRADALARRLAESDFAYDRLSNVSFDFDEGDESRLRRIDAIMRGDTPVVFVNGRMKSNPDYDEVVAEYRAANAGSL